MAIGKNGFYINVFLGKIGYFGWTHCSTYEWNKEEKSDNPVLRDEYRAWCSYIGREWHSQGKKIFCCFCQLLYSRKIPNTIVLIPLLAQHAMASLIKDEVVTFFTNPHE